MENKTNRIRYIDIIRALAIILLVTGHTLGYSQNSRMVYQGIYSFVVPMFFMVSGFVVKRRGTFFEFIKVRFTRIMVPYFVWAVLYLVPYLMLGETVAKELGKATHIDWFVLLKNIMYGIGKDASLRQNSSLWFLPALFVMDSAFYVITSIVDKMNKKSVSYGMFVVLALVGYIANKYLEIDLPWGINTLFVAGIYYYMGWYLRANNGIAKIMQSSAKYVLGPILVAVGLIAGFSNRGLDFMDYDIGNIWLAYSSGICLSIAFMCVAFRIGENRILEYIGRNTMSIMLFHKIPILICQTRLGVITDFLKNSNVVVEVGLSVAIALTAVLFSLCIATVLKKYAPALIGERKKVST